MRSLDLASIATCTSVEAARELPRLVAAVFLHRGGAWMTRRRSSLLAGLAAAV
jgi:hypothetical protein